MARTAQQRSVDRVFRALPHAGRRRLLTTLHGRAGLTLSELAGLLPMSRQAVSQHLALLEAADLVATRWSGREKLHYLNAAPLADTYVAWLAPLITPEAMRLVALRDRVESEAAREPARPARARHVERAGEARKRRA